MIIILDDTFVERHKFHDVDFLKEEVYSKICSVHSVIKTTDLSSLVEILANCSFLCNHKTLQLYDNGGNPLNNEDNIAYRENLLKKISLLGIKKIEFSRGLETNIEVDKIDKDLFYSNLKNFLDYYIQEERIESRILFYGSDFEEQERLSVVQKMMMQIRSIDFDDFENDEIIKKGISVLYSQEIIEVIKQWRNNKLSKNEIINEINKELN